MRNTHNPIPQAVWLVLGLGVLAMAWRFLPHAPNLAPVAALALFAAWMTGRAWLGAALAVGIMAVSDAVVGFYDLRVQAVVWTALALPALFARIDEIIKVETTGLIRARHLASNLAGDVINFEIGNAADAAFAGKDLGPVVIHPDTKRCDHP